MPAKLVKYSNDLIRAEVNATVTQTIQNTSIDIRFVIPVADLIAIDPAWGKTTVAAVCSVIGGFTVDLATPAVVTP